MNSDTNIPICHLCEDCEANATGSHIIPSFLAKRFMNRVGTLERDQEATFIFDSLDKKVYAGKLSEENIKKIFGELDEPELEKLTASNPDVRDNIFCATCETNLGKMEGYYASKRFGKGGVSISKKIEGNVGLIFWASIVWRLQFLQLSNHTISNSKFELLRRLVKKGISDFNIKKPSNLKYFSRAEKKLGYIILRNPDYRTESNFASFFSLDERVKNNCFMLIDEFIIFFTFSSNYSITKANTYGAFPEEYLAKEVLNRAIANDESLIELSYEEMSNYAKGIVKRQYDKTKQFFEERLNQFVAKYLPGLPLKIKEHLIHNVHVLAIKLSKENDIGFRDAYKEAGVQVFSA